MLKFNSKYRYNKVNVTLSIVLPSYKSADILARRVPGLLGYLNNLGLEYEVIIVDDKSDDDGHTQRVAKKLGCIYITNPKNMGKGAAVRRGMHFARGRFRIYTDADIPYELETIEKFLWYLDFKEYHFIAGDRTLPESSYFDEVPQFRRFGSHFISFIVGRFIVGGWFDTQCGIKGFRDYVANDLFSVSSINGFAFDIELFYIALKRNYDIKRLPVRLEYQGQSSVRASYDGLLILRDIFIIRWNQFKKKYRQKTPVSTTVDTYPGEYYNRSDSIIDE